MPGEELTEALSKARQAVDAGDSWESSPERSGADAASGERRNSGGLDAANERAAVSVACAAAEIAAAVAAERPDPSTVGVASSAGVCGADGGNGEATPAPPAADDDYEPAGGAGGGAVGEGEPVRVYDGIPLVKEATELKEQANACVKRKRHQEAVKLYEEALGVLKPCDGHPMLSEERQAVLALRAVLHCNISQCMLSLELYRRAIDAATECLKLDPENVKALHRRSQAYEILKEYEEALRDALAIKKVGGEGVDAKQLEKRCEELYEKQIAVNKAVNEFSKTNEDTLKMKERFDEVMEKYDLGDGLAAPLVAEWLCADNDLAITVGRVAKQWEMSKKEAEHFAKWIKKGLDMGVIPKPGAAGGASGGQPQRP